MDITEFSILHHVGIVLVLLWILSYFSCCHPIVYFISFIYLYQVNECYTLKLRRRLQFQEKKKANQKRLLSDSETVRWLNHAVEKVWPICMEHVASQKILLPIIPWFLDKYKPWTARKAMVQELYLGRSPPMFTEIRVLRQSSDDDHLVLELGMSFISAEDMNATLAVKLTKRLGFGIWTKMHITGMHVEGKVLVGVKFLPQWPFLGRLRICFVEPPYFQMTVKPIFNHGLDVTELPGIAGCLDKILAVAFEQTLVEPNMLVVDMEKFASQTEQWFSMDEKCPIAFAKVEIVEAAEMKPSDLNGLADPYVRGQLGPYKFHTKIQKRTLAPKWQEEFKIPISTWESPNVLLLEVRDKDHFVDDILGDCSININELRSCQRHDMWLPLQHIDMGRLHVAVTVIDQDEKEHLSDKDISNKKENTDDVTTKEAVLQETNEQTSKMADEFEPIGIEGQQKTRVWLHHPGSDLTQTWEPRKRNDRGPRTEIHAEDNNSIDSPGPVASEPQQCDSGSGRENPRGNKLTPLAIIRRSIKKLGSVFDRSPRNESPNDKDEVAPTPRPNIRAVGDKVISVKFVMDDHNFKATKEQKSDNSLSPASEASSPGKGHKGGMAESILKQAGKSAHHITHVFHKKSSKNSNECPGSTAADGGNQDSGSTNEEALPSSKGHSPRVEGIILDTASLSSSGKEPPNFEDEEKYLEKKLSFNDKDSADGSTAGCGACIIKDATSQGAESTNDDVVIGLQESQPGKSSSRYADRTNGDVMGGIEVEASSKHENFEGSSEEKR